MERSQSKRALTFVVLMGLISLFSDATYEGARSITGPFLEVLKASAAVVGIVAGFGEFAGYGLRLVFGYLADRTKRYWTLTILGYTVNLLAVPVLALVSHWWLAAVFIVLERIGKAIRTPSRDAMLSYASCEVGRGFTFGLHEALDQIGAILGPLFVAWVLSGRGSYNQSFAYLLIPAIIALGILMVTRFIYPTPQHFEPLTPELTPRGLSRAFKLYLVSMALIAAGYADFPLIAYHMEHHSVASPEWIPLLYATAMGVDALAAIVLGKLFDRMGLKVLFVPILVSMFFPIFAFSQYFHGAFLGMILWGIGMGSQESIMRAAVANMVSSEKRATAYGIFNSVFGACWFGGSALMGILYDVSVSALVAFSVAIQALAVLTLWITIRSRRS